MLVSDLRYHIIRPTLKALSMWSDSAEELLLGTAAHESHLGRWCKQEGGRALGIYQMEPATYSDILNRYLMRREDRRRELFRVCNCCYEPPAEQLMWDLRLSTCMARIKYAMVPEPLPAPTDRFGLAKYWKTHYNTEHGKGTLDQFMQDYGRFVTRDD